MASTRRDWLRSMTAAGVGLGAMQCSWARALSSMIVDKFSQQHLIVLWMAGGPSQLDTFDMKVGHAHGGEFKDAPTAVPGIRFSEHLPKLAKLADRLAIIRSLETKEGDHGRGTFLVRTGQRPGSPLKYPALAASIAKELSPQDAMVPDYVSVLPPTFINPMAFGSGFLGPNHEPLTVGSQTSGPADAMAELRVENLLPPGSLSTPRIQRRREFWEMLQTQYDARHRVGAPQAHDTMQRRAMRLSDSELRKAFDIGLEKEEVRRAYGTSAFGQGCLMARRLVEQGVPVVEVTLGNGGLGWDTHADNFKQVKSLSEQLDSGWSQLMIDLDERGLLQNTTVLWIGEFGRTPVINPQAGRDHFPDAWSCVLAGGRIAGGQVYGATTDDGMKVADSPVTIQRVLATVATSTGVDPQRENISELGRPIKIVEAEPIPELLT